MHYIIWIWMIFISIEYKDYMDNENKIVFREVDFESTDMTEIEIRYARHVVNKLIPMQDFIGEFDIRTNPEELRRFIIDVVRGYEAFNDNLINHF